MEWDDETVADFGHRIQSIQREWVGNAQGKRPTSYASQVTYHLTAAMLAVRLIPTPSNQPPPDNPTPADVPPDDSPTPTDS